MHGSGFEIGTALRLDPLADDVITLFFSQRRRLLETAHTFTDDEWRRPTRCTEWDARQLFIHVDGATDACRLTLTGEYPIFEGGFNPNESPKAFVDLRADEALATTLDRFGQAIGRTEPVIAAQRRLDPAPTVTALWGQPIDWRLFVLHFLFDGWIHERDLLLPLGRTPAVVDAEARLVAGYSLYFAAVVSGLMGVPLDATLRLDGPGSATFRITANHEDAVVAVAPYDPADGPSNGEAVAIADALAGRGPELAAVLDAPPELVDALSCIGLMLRG